MPGTVPLATLADGLGGITSVVGAVSPPVLFFALGFFAAMVRSNLTMPPAVTKLLSLYLLWAIGFTGGVKLHDSGLTADVVAGLGAAMLLACVVPVYCYFILRRRLGRDDAAAIAACYGSVSAVTFVTAQQWLTSHGMEFGGHMVAAMALMESPAIVIAVLLLRLGRGKEEDQAGSGEPASTKAAGKRSGGRGERGGWGGWGVMLHEAFFNGAVLLLMGSLVIGVLTGKQGYQAFKPLSTDLFSGVLAFFLLDLGIICARRLRGLKKAGPFLVGFGLIMPVCNAILGIALAKLVGVREGDAVLLAVLAGSASYIAVPAAAQIAIPKADASLYVPMALAITFPFNISLGIPLYAAVVRAWWGG